MKCKSLPKRRLKILKYCLLLRTRGQLLFREVIIIYLALGTIMILILHHVESREKKACIYNLWLLRISNPYWYSWCLSRPIVIFSYGVRGVKGGVRSTLRVMSR